MPIDIADVDEGRGNILTGSGVVTGKEFVNALKAHLTQDIDKFRRYRYSLADYTGVTNIKEVPVSDIRMVANLCKQASQLNPDAVVAVVAGQDVVFGLSRMWEMFLDGTNWATKVFRTRDDAEAWIRETVRRIFGIDDLTMR